MDEITDDELAAFDRTLGKLRARPVDDPVRLRAEQAAASFARDGRQRRRKSRQRRRVAADAEVTAATATGALGRRADAPLSAETAQEVGEYRRPRNCYVCKEFYRQVHGFYHLLCPACAADNAARRSLRTDLTGRRVLLTGGRVKIGFQLALMMLRDGAELLLTTRFPHDAVRRFRAAPGSETWWDRLTVVAIDLRDPRQVLGMCASLREQGQPLEILVNNAAQTVRRPPQSYALLTAGESEALPDMVLRAPGFCPMLPGSTAGAGDHTGPHSLAGSPGERDPRLSPSRTVPAMRDTEAMDEALASLMLDGADEAGLLPDRSPSNSWSAQLGELDPAELLETQLVNAVAPTLLCDRLLPLLLASPYPRRYIINVTAVEGRFAVRHKTPGHPHTNMAKAALNMLTRTSGPELSRQGVHMCSVDTGWITDENPVPKKTRIAAQGFRTPLDIVDGAARVYDPIVRGEAGAPISGVFLKDYQEAQW